jgi:hypothetical protein
MNDRYSYTSLHIETLQAKQRLTQVFQDGRPESRSLPEIEDGPAANEHKEATDRPWLPPEVTRQRKVHRDPWENAESPKDTEWTQRDMSAFSFILTLLLFGTIAAANTDRPPFWLLIGPAPLAVGFVAVAFLRQRFDLHAYLLALRRRNRQSENS